jgi:broad specificity phosphatase PhoE
VLDRLLLVRHGEVHNPGHVVYADLPGFGLSDAGRRQAEATAAHLAASGATLLLSSPLERAVQTAEPIGAALGLPLVVDDRLTEWLLARRWAGVAWDDLPEVFPGEIEAYLAHPWELPFSPEQIGEAGRRLIDVADELGARYPSATAVLVSHQDPVQAARLLLTGRALTEVPNGKPAHGTVLAFVPDSAGWREAERWDPDVHGARPFPPSS